MTKIQKISKDRDPNKEKDRGSVSNLKSTAFIPIFLPFSLSNNGEKKNILWKGRGPKKGKGGER